MILDDTKQFLKGRSVWTWLVAATVFLMAGLSITHWAQEEAFEDEVQKVLYEIEQMHARNRQLVQSQYQRSADQIMFLTRTPPIAGIRRALANRGTDPRNGESLAVWLGRLQVISEALLLSDRAIYSVLTFDTADTSSAATAVARNSDDPGDLTVNFARQFQPELTLSGALDNPENTYFSGIYRIGVGPLAGRSAFQVAHALRMSDLGHYFVLQIASAATDLINTIANTAVRGVNVWLVDEQGRFIFHPEPAKIFNSAQLTQAATIQSEFTERPDVALPSAAKASNARVVQDRAGQRWLMVSAPMRPARTSALGGLSPLVLYSGIPWTILEKRASESSGMVEAMIWIMCLAIVALMTQAVLSRRAVLSPADGLIAPSGPGKTLHPLSSVDGPSRWIFAVIVGVASAALVYLVVGLALPDLPFPYIVMFSAVLFASTSAGLVGGATASVFGALAALDLATTSSPLMDFSGADAQLVAGAVFMLLVGVALSYFQERMRLAGVMALQAEHKRAAEQQKAQEVLLAETTRRAMIMETAADAIYIVDRKGDLVLFNPAFAQMLGYSDAEMRKLNARDWQASNASTEQVLEQLLVSDQIHQFEVKHRRKNGSVYDAEVSAKSVTLEGQTLLYVSARDISARKAAQHELEQRLQERTTLLDEVHHRVKNNLQVVSGLLMLQQLGSDNETVREQLQISRDRISAIARIHEQLYKGERFDRIDFRWYTQELFETMNSASDLSGRGVSLVLHDGTFNLPLQEAVPCGLLLHELISNAIKHAFPNGRRGQVWVSLSQTAEGRRIMEVGDDGVGMPESVQDLGTLGLDLVQRLAAQLGATLMRRPSAVGTVYALELPEATNETTGVES